MDTDWIQEAAKPRSHALLFAKCHAEGAKDPMETKYIPWVDVKSWSSKNIVGGVGLKIHTR